MKKHFLQWGLENRVINSNSHSMAGVGSKSCSCMAASGFKKVVHKPMVDIMEGCDSLIGDFGCFCWFLVDVSWTLLDFVTERGTCGKMINEAFNYNMSMNTLKNRLKCHWQCTCKIT